jgi:hypothetical protein
MVGDRPLIFEALRLCEGVLESRHVSLGDAVHCCGLPWSRTFILGTNTMSFD